MTVTPLTNLSVAVNSQPAVVAVHCELVRGTEALVMLELLPRVKRESIALDLSDVARMDAAGIAGLISLYCTSMESGTHFSVVAPSPHVLELLRIVGLDSILLVDQFSEHSSSGSNLKCQVCPAA